MTTVASSLQALLIEDDALLRSLVSVQQFGSRSKSFSQVVAMARAASK